jgi:DNA gyrase subunit A
MEGTEQKIPVNIEDEMRKSYLDYAMSVIIGRALPDVRDGLKPVHRRVLFAMNESGNTSDKPYRKSAKTVGDVIGKYHPHGDSPVYDTIVRMAQDFSLRYPLVDGQGNFGSVDGDPPAAMRYTEIRLEKIAGTMLADIDKETIDFGPNYDGSEQEPLVLPTRLPNLLVNGSSGIAVGMATNIPPHNLGEVCDALTLLIDNPEANLDEIMEKLPAPDFPTGAYIFGMEGVREAYRTGRGKVMMRCKAEIEEIPKKERQQIVVTELPYQVNKALLIEEIARLVQDKRIDGISDIRDESDRDGIRIVIELRRGEVADIILNNLYKHTKMQQSFGMIFLAIQNNQPRVFALKDLLHSFIDFRKEVIVRRTAFELRKAEERAHILEGLTVALDHLDEVITIIRASKTPPEAKAALSARVWPDVTPVLARLAGSSAAAAAAEGFRFSEAQAQAILDMRLQRLTGLEREKIVQEYKEVLALIERLRAILGSEALVLQIVKEELAAIRDDFADERRTQVLEGVKDLTIEELIAEEEMVITVSHGGYCKRTALSTYRSQRRGGKGRTGMSTREEDFVEQLFVASTHDYILAFSSKGRLHWLKVHEIPEIGPAARGKPIVNLLRLDEGEAITALLSVREFAEGRYVVMATRRGVIKKTPLSAFSNVRAVGIIALSIDEGDGLLAVKLSGGESEVFLATKRGKAIRFNEKDVRPMGRTARGVRGIRLRQDDELIEMEVLEGRGHILTVTERGYGKRTKVEDYRLQGRGGSGIINLRVTQKNQPVVGAMETGPGDQIMMVTGQGKIIRMETDEISAIGRATQGVRLLDVEEGDSVVSVVRLPERDEEAEAAKPVAAAPDEPEEPIAEDEERDEPGAEEDNGGDGDDQPRS